nr:MAG TPA: hypothetical protein [Caudoviricetes sp.]
MSFVLIVASVTPIRFAKVLTDNTLVTLPFKIKKGDLQKQVAFHASPL